MSDTTCTHCRSDKKPGEPYFWIHGVAGIPGYCVDCAVRIMRAAHAFVAAQSPLAQGDFAGDKFDDLERAVAPGSLT